MTAPNAARTDAPPDLLRPIARAVTPAFRWVTALVPSRRLAAVVAIASPVWLASGTPTGLAAAIAVTTLVVLAALADTLTLPARWEVSVSREFPERIGLGDEAEARYVVHTRRRRPVRFRMFDALPRGLTADAARSGSHRTDAGHPCVLPVSLVGRERGAWPLGPVVVRVDGWLGLVQRTLPYDPGDTSTVVPSMRGLRRYRLLSLHHRLRDLGVRAIRRRGEGGVFSSLREYVVGDDPRRIDWKATAKRGELITREYTVEQGQTVILALDAGRMMTQLENQVPRFEYALSSAVLLADVATQSRDHVGALVFDDEIRAWVPPTRGHAALERINRAVVPTVATMAEPDYAAAFRVLGERQRKRSLIVLFTDVIDVRASQSLIALASRSAARHIIIAVVALRNERLLGAALPDAASSTRGLFEAAAAEELVTAREAALSRMRSAGVSVLDVSPHAMTAAVINRYLELKARSLV